MNAFSLTLRRTNNFINACKKSSNTELNNYLDAIKSLPTKTINQGFILLCQKGNSALIKKFIELKLDISNSTLGLAYQIFSKNNV